LLRQTVSRADAARIIGFDESDPHRVLGPREVEVDGEKVLSVRAFLPRARRAWLRLPTNEELEMTRVEEGLFEAQTDAGTEYLIGQSDEDGYVEERADPYAFPPLLPDADIHLMAEGKCFRAHSWMGAHLTSIRGVRGVAFAVWAPNAKSVAVVGNFNHWSVGEEPMRARGDSGIWELFVPGLEAGEVYKFAVKNRASGEVKEKVDPFAFGMELRPRTGSVVVDLGKHVWQDAEWQEQKKSWDGKRAPVSVYEVHLGSWKRASDGRQLTYDELAEELVPYVREMGFTHVELMPIMEHPLDDSWGYQVVNYFAPTSRYGPPESFMRFVDACHRQGIGVILDWVPAHFPKDDYGLGLYDGTHLYEHADPRLGEHPDWGTYIFNYGRNEVRSFLVSSALFWIEKYHADGIRMDAVASMLYLDYSRKEGEWVPNRLGGRENLDAISLLREVNDQAHGAFPGTLTIAEESTAWPGVTADTRSGGLGFDLKWNMGWMHDTLSYFSLDPVYRKFHQDQLTFSLWYAFSERFILVLSHDEVVYGKGSMLTKMPGDEWQKFANLRLCYGYMFAHPGKKLLFMGSELGQREEWNFRASLAWGTEGGYQDGLRRLVRDLNGLYTSKEPLHSLDTSPDGFEWIDFGDYENGILGFVRKSRTGSPLVAVCNMTPVPRTDYRVGVPVRGRYNEILNSDAQAYGGSGMGNLGGTNSEAVKMHGREDSVVLTLPPLSILLLEHSGS
jgi:1,4-alpha-glucan branching enzyme